MTASDRTTGQPLDPAHERPAGRRRVLITRPPDQSRALIAGCRQLGLTPLSLPSLAIEALVPPAGVRAPQQGLALFTSANAVRHAHAFEPLPWPGVDTLAIGPATATALTDLGQPPLMPPVPPYTSEALIETLLCAPAGVLSGGVTLVSGENGRRFMVDRLREHGCRVGVLEVYRRIAPTVDAATLETLLNPMPDVIISSSDESLDNLLRLVTNRAAALRHCVLIVNSDRNACHARERGFDATILVARQAGDQGQLERLGEWCSATDG